MNLEKHLKTIELMEYELRHRLKEYDLDLSNELKDEKEWYTKSQKVKMVFGNNIVIDYQEGIYIVFKEKNLNFNLTEGKIKVNELDEYNLVFEGKNLDKGNTKVFIVEYNRKKEKVKVNSYPLNTKKNLKFEKDTRFIRIAFRTEGTGTSIISNFNFSMKKKSKKISQILTDPKNKPIKKIKDMNVIFIADEFTTRSFEPEFNVIKVSPENWQKEVEGKDIDFFFCESAWQGNDGKWQYKIAEYNKQDQTELLELLEFCEENKIPSVFWNKEDPVHYDRFINTAKKFNHIFTTDINTIDEYRKSTGHSNIYPLQFAAQPLYNNPLMKYEKRLEKCCFAGTYFQNRYPERQESTKNILREGQKYGLDIYDRNYLLDKEELKFPKEFDRNIKGTLKYYEIDKAYKGYKCLLNVNSVTESPTMFSRRVFEALASNTPVISTYSKGIANTFKDSIKVFKEEKYLVKYFENIMNNKQEFEKLKLKGLREVMQFHTYKNRVEYLINKIGIRYKEEKNDLINCISVCKSKDEVNKIIKMFEYQSYENKKLKLFITNFTGYEEIINNHNTINIEIYNLEFLDILENISKLCLFGKIAFFSSNNYYGKNYLLDLALAFIYSKASIVTKSDYKTLIEMKNTDYYYTNSGKLENSLIDSEIIKNYGIEDFKKLIFNEIDIQYFSKLGFRILRIDGFNYLENTSNLLKENYWIEV